MTYAEFVDLINSPGVLMLLFVVTYVLGFAVLWAVQKLRGKDIFE